MAGVSFSLHSCFTRLSRTTWSYCQLYLLGEFWEIESISQCSRWIEYRNLGVILDWPRWYFLLYVKGKLKGNAEEHSVRKYLVSLFSRLLQAMKWGFFLSCCNFLNPFRLSCAESYSDEIITTNVALLHESVFIDLYLWSCRLTYSNKEPRPASLPLQSFCYSRQLQRKYITWAKACSLSLCCLFPYEFCPLISDSEEGNVQTNIFGRVLFRKCALFIFAYPLVG